MKKQFKLHTILLSSLISLSSLTVTSQATNHNGLYEENNPNLENINYTSTVINLEFKATSSYENTHLYTDTLPNYLNLNLNKNIFKKIIIIINGISDLGKSSPFNSNSSFFKRKTQSWSVEGNGEKIFFETKKTSDYLSKYFRYGILTAKKNDTVIFKHLVDSSGKLRIYPTGVTSYNLSDEFDDKNPRKRDLTLPQWAVNKKKGLLKKMSVANRATKNIIEQWKKLREEERQVIIKQNSGIELTVDEFKTRLKISPLDFSPLFKKYDFSAPYTLNNRHVFGLEQSKSILKTIGYSHPTKEELILAEKKLINAGVGITPYYTLIN